MMPRHRRPTPNSPPIGFGDFTELLSSPMLSLRTGARIASSGMCSSGVILVILTSTVAWRDFFSWWLTYPSEKYEFISWDDDIPYGKTKAMCQTTNQIVLRGNRVLKKKKRGKSHTVRGAFIATMKTTVLGDCFFVGFNTLFLSHSKHCNQPTVEALAEWISR